MDDLDLLLQQSETPQESYPQRLVAGAPLGVRAMVGGVADQDRLATLRKYFPDAQPEYETQQPGMIQKGMAKLMGQPTPQPTVLPTDNFNYTDPKTGKKTLYNPKGLDVGDIASLMRDAMVQGGGAVGGTAAGLAATPATLGAGTIPAALAGKMAGSAAGGQLFDIAAHSFGGAPDTTTALDKAVQVGTDAISLPVGEKIGDLIANALAKSARVLPWAGGKLANWALVGKEVPQLAQDMKAAGIDPTLANTADTVASKLLTGASAAMMTGEPLQTGARTTLGQTDRALSALGSDIAKGMTAGSKNEAGSSLKVATKKAHDALMASEDQVFRNADTLNADATVTPDNLVRFVTGAKEQLGPTAIGRPGEKGALDFLEKKTLGSFKPEGSQAQSAARQEAEALFGGPAPTGELGSLPFDQARGLRTTVGANSRVPNLTAEQATGKPIFKQAYAALTQDIEKSLSPEGLAAMRSADKSWKNIQENVLPEFERIMNASSDTQAYGALTNMLRNGVEHAQTLKQYLKPEEWQSFVGTMVKNLGTKDGETFSPSVFLSNWRKLSASGNEARMVLFDTPEVATRMDKLANIVDKIQKAEGMANRSNTAGVSLVQRLLTNPAAMSATGSALGAFGGTESAAMGAGLGASYAISVPYLTSRLMTNPKALDALIELGSAELKGANPAGAFSKTVKTLSTLGTQEAAQPKQERKFDAEKPQQPVSDELEALLQAGGA